VRCAFRTLPAIEQRMIDDFDQGSGPSLFVMVVRCVFGSIFCFMSVVFVVYIS
jgi:hypothetical protein